MMRVVIAMDSFKGSLSSEEAGTALAEGLRQAISDIDIRVVPIADGGEGTAEAVAAARRGRYVETQATDPIGRTIPSRYVTIENDSTAIISLAAASGITLLRPEERNPLITTTYGTGELILDALSLGAHNIVVGLGGSATTDGGVGLLRALGYRFYDGENRELSGHTIDILERVEDIDGSQASSLLRSATLSGMVDVDNPLLGVRGAANVFARQKGASDADVERIEQALTHYATVVARCFGRDVATAAGSGAAGGVGYAFRAILGTELNSGIEAILDLADIDTHISTADLVVTGEGRIDTQTLMGKAPSGLLRRAVKHQVRCIAVGGSVEHSEQLDKSGFARIYQSMPDGMSLSEAMHPTTARANLRAVGGRIATDLLISKA